MKKVLICKDGGWGMVKPDEYQDLIDILKRVLEDVTVPGLNGKIEKAAEIKVVTTEEVEKILKSGTHVDTLVFFSRGKERIAENIAAAYPRTKVVVFTGLLPEGKVVWVEKRTLSIETIQKIVL